MYKLFNWFRILLNIHFVWLNGTPLLIGELMYAYRDDIFFAHMLVGCFVYMLEIARM